MASKSYTVNELVNNASDVHIFHCERYRSERFAYRSYDCLYAVNDITK